MDDEFDLWGADPAALDMNPSGTSVAIVGRKKWWLFGPVRWKWTVLWGVEVLAEGPRWEATVEEARSGLHRVRVALMNPVHVVNPPRNMPAQRPAEEKESPTTGTPVS